MKTAWRGGPWLRLVGLGLLVALAACGDDNKSTTPTTTPPTVPPTTLPAGTTVIQGTELVPARQLFISDFVTDRAGRVDVTISYAFADSDILVWVTDRKCSRQMFENDSCDYLGKSLEGSSPRTLSFPSVAAGTYTLFVHNNGVHDEQLTYKVVLTP